MRIIDNANPELYYNRKSLENELHNVEEFFLKRVLTD